MLFSRLHKNKKALTTIRLVSTFAFLSCIILLRFPFVKCFFDIFQNFFTLFLPSLSATENAVCAYYVIKEEKTKLPIDMPQVKCYNLIKIKRYYKKEIIIPWHFPKAERLSAKSKPKWM